MPAPILVAADAIPAGAVLCDVRFYLDGRDTRHAFAAGHLPGAVFVDLATALSGPGDAGHGRHPLPSPEAFAAELGALGIGDDDHVVASDDLRGTVAARLVWLLRLIGRPASLLDGGLEAWPGELETGPPAPRTPVRRTPVPWPEERLADLHEIEAGVPELLDARPPATAATRRAPTRASATSRARATRPRAPTSSATAASRPRRRSGSSSRTSGRPSSPAARASPPATRCSRWSSRAWRAASTPARSASGRPTRTGRWRRATRPRRSRWAGSAGPR